MNNKYGTVTLGSDILGNYLQEIGKFDLLTKKEQLELGSRWWNDGDKDAYKKLVSNMLRRVVSIAKSYRDGDIGSSLDFLDLIQAGNEGLMHATGRYDPGWDCKLNTYANKRITNFITELILNQKNPVVKAAVQRNINKIKDVLKKRDGNRNIDLNWLSENLDWLSEKTGLGKRKLGYALDAMNCQISSIDDTNPDNGGRPKRQYKDTAPLQDTFKDIEELKGEMGRLWTEVTEKVLTDRESYILEKRVDEDPVTLKELGDEFDVTRERIRQIQKNAIKKIRGYLERNPELKRTLWEFYVDI